MNDSNAHLAAVRNQGQELLNANQLAEAKVLFAELCRLNPGDIHAWHNLSIINGRLGNMEEAGECCRRVLGLQPDHSEALIYLGHVFFHYRRFDDAITQYKRALQLNPRSIPALNNLGMACQSDEHFQVYVQHYRSVAALLANAGEVRADLARAMFIGLRKERQLTAYDPWLDEELCKYYETCGIEFRETASFVARLLRLKYDIRPPVDGEIPVALIARVASDQLFLKYLERTLNTDDVLEIWLTRLRRYLLFRRDAAQVVESGLHSLTIAMAMQCMNNEYLLMLDDEEQLALAVMRNEIERLAASLPGPNKVLEAGLMVVAMYQRLDDLACSAPLGRMPRAAWSDDVRPLVERALFEPLEERWIKADIPRITEILDATSQLVQSQYEENPYPRWVSIMAARKRNIGIVLKQHFHHFEPPTFLSGPLRILIAGCGTGKHAIQVALSYANADVLAVDISASSLAYAIRMARKLGVDNIRFMQGDILQLSELDTRFHIIESSGVLHHMEDPLRGWQVLTGLLVEGGLLYIGLYSEKARKHIAAAREVIKVEGVAPDVDGIRDFRVRILRGDLGADLSALAHNSYDFYSTSGCRDLLFHFQEHRFTIPQIDAALAELRLHFIGFVHSRADTINRYRVQFPEDPYMTDLRLWDRFESRYPATFGQMYQFWCQWRTACSPNQTK